MSPLLWGEKKDLSCPQFICLPHHVYFIIAKYFFLPILIQQILFLFLYIFRHQFRLLFFLIMMVPYYMVTLFPSYLQHHDGSAVLQWLHCHPIKHPWLNSAFGLKTSPFNESYRLLIFWLFYLFHPTPVTSTHSVTIHSPYILLEFPASNHYLLRHLSSSATYQSNPNVVIRFKQDVSLSRTSSLTKSSNLPYLK
jgi:hypothetical protein